jgi:hypothetical protein
MFGLLTSTPKSNMLDDLEKYYIEFFISYSAEKSKGSESESGSTGCGYF